MAPRAARIAAKRGYRPPIDLSTLTRSPSFRSTATAQAALALAVVGVACIAVVTPLGAIAIVAGAAVLLLAIQRFVGLVAVFMVLTFPAVLPFGVGPDTLAKPLGAILVLAWLIELGRGRDIPLLFRDHPALTAVIVAFTAWAAISTLWARDSGVAVTTVGRLAQVVVLFAIVYSAARSRREVRFLAGAYVFASAATALYALLSGITIAGRLTGGVLNSNELAEELIPAIAIASFMAFGMRRGTARLTVIAALGVDVVAFVLTQSRGGLVGLAVAALVGVVVAGRWRPQVVTGVAASVALAVTYYGVIAAPTVRDRITNLSAQGSAGRTDLWRVAVRMFSAHPIDGIGIGNFPVVARDYATTTMNFLQVRYVIGGFVTHNTYLQVLSELGLVGELLLLAFLVMAIAPAARVVCARMPPVEAELSAIGRGIIAGLGGMLTSYFFGSKLYEKQLWLLLALFLGTAAVHARTRLLRTSNSGEAAGDSG